MPTTDTSALVDDLARNIRDLIVSGEIAAGTPLRQADLAERFGTSRTPVREALRQLQAGGLIEIYPHRGAVVRIPTPWEVREAYEVRAELEALAARRAATRLSSDDIDRMREHNDKLFELTRAAARDGAEPSRSQILDEANEHALHPTILAAADNARLQSVLDGVQASLPKNVPGLLLLENASHREENHREHTRIIDALATHDADEAGRLMRDHVIAAGEQVARWYERRSSSLMTR
ncbi:GntR family transcriptional regulator [Demequina sp. NBRC 110051]|uniref:GntR family transcriptional regulator n=1 Tax=Demequina sp. NBRC 110051 TaxID=1570340 RepID=UPI000A04AE99|nr:GntR family transcriptional regulator [Demequina sp. NBRC 110051]